MPTKEYLKEWRKRNPYKQSEYQKRWYERNPDWKPKIQDPKWYRNYSLLTQYNLTAEEWQKLFDSQGHNMCYLWRRPKRRRNSFF